MTQLRSLLDILEHQTNDMAHSTIDTETASLRVEIELARRLIGEITQGLGWAGQNSSLSP
jgi:hypothetical protein